eukprot:12382453-Alexandrium_andersonii.AAC.1
MGSSRLLLGPWAAKWKQHGRPRGMSGNPACSICDAHAHLTWQYPVPARSWAIAAARAERGIRI